jgi:hypothetical protein
MRKILGTYFFDQFRNCLFTQSNTSKTVNSDAPDVTGSESSRGRHCNTVWFFFVFLAQFLDDFSHKYRFSSTCRASEENTLSAFDDGLKHRVLFVAEEDSQRLVA